MLKQIGDLQTNYDVTGKGYPLILLHGGGADSITWEDILPYLTGTFDTYRMDLRGFGQTVRPPQPTLSLELWTSDLKNFMDNMGLHSAALAGWSLGGVIAMDFAAAYPERASHIVLIGAPSPMVHVTDRSGFEMRKQLAERGAPIAEVVEKTFEFTKNAFSPYSLAHNQRSVDRMKAALLRNSPGSYVEMVQSLARLGELKPKLSRISCPTLILVGDADARTPVQAAEDLNKAIDNSYMKIVLNCGHFYGYEQPELTSRYMSQFLTAFGARSR